jgi:acyl-CoA reductase-like NAD-dependent aldehyde dehydrogenase
MSQLDDQRINQIVGDVLSQVRDRKAGFGAPAVTRVAPVTLAPVKAATRRGIYDDIDGAAKAARGAFEQYMMRPLADRYQACEALRAVCRAYCEEMSARAVEESTYGRVEDKIKKNRLAIEKTPGPEDLVPRAWSGDEGLAILERAPWGVVGAITPVTNITETLICNAIGMIAAGNSVVFNVHPFAKRTSSWLISLMNEALVRAGLPENLLCGVAEPTIESAQELMSHKGIQLLVVTGGPAVVAAAMRNGKSVVAAGPGNPPVVVDETADLDRAARGIIQGASLDNNIICLDEKVLIAVASIADELTKCLKRHGAFQLNHSQMDRLADRAIPEGRPARDCVGKNAGVIIDYIGLGGNPGLRLAFGEVEEEHPWVQHEQLMPIIPLVRARDVDEAIEMAYRVEHNFFHTAVMYSTNIENLHRMARRCNCSIFVKNSIAVAGIGFGGEGHASFTIASPTGHGVTSARHFTRERRCTVKDYFRIL